MKLEDLAMWGADVKDGLARCMNMEPFYLRLCGTVKGEPNFEALFAALEAGEAESAFKAAHALKGVLGNLSLTPLYEPAAELTELLRGKDVVAEEDAERVEELAALIRERFAAFCEL